jgi:hypothetical protein
VKFGWQNAVSMGEAKMSKPRNSIKAVLMTGLTFLTWAAAQAAPVAVITDIQGRAVNPQSQSISLLSEVESDSRIQLDDKARIVAVYYSSGSEFTVRGPAVVQFKSDGPQAISGNAPEKRAVLASAGKDVRLKPGGLARAAYMMMGAPSAIKLLSLSDTRTVDTKPEFRWSSIEPAKAYEVKLMNDGGAVVFATSTAATSVALPQHLTPGKRYTWRVTAPLSDGTTSTSIGEFSVATPELRTQVAAARPAETATLSEKVAFAIWLEQQELRDEARKYWQVARTEWPNNQRLEALANRE